MPADPKLQNARLPTSLLAFTWPLLKQPGLQRILELLVVLQIVGASSWTYQNELDLPDFISSSFENLFCHLTTKSSTLQLGATS